MKNEIQVLKQTELLGRRLTVYGTMQEPLFLAKDIAEWIEHSNPAAMLNTVDDDEKGIRIVYTPGGDQKVNVLTEDGLYEVLMQSRKPIAKQFKKGVKQILKEIRTTGGYIATQVNETPEMIMARALKVAEHTIEEHERKMRELSEENEQAKMQNKILEADIEQKQGEIKKMTPYADYAQKTLLSSTTYNTNLIAKELGMSAKTLNQHLKRLGVQYKQHDVWVLSSKYVNKGYTKTTTFNYTASDGTQKSRMQTEWTEHGRAFIHWLHDNGKFSTSISYPETQGNPQ